MTRNRSLLPYAAQLPLLLLLLLLALGFAACNQASGPEEAAGPSRLVGRYELAGDMFFLRPPSDTDRFCNGDSLTEEVDVSGADTSIYRLAGDRLWVSSDFKSRPPDGPPFTLRKHTGLRRLTGREGIQGWWRWDTTYNEVVAGALDAETQARQDAYLRADLTRLHFIEIDLGYFSGELRMRQDGRMADLFLAEWNGEVLLDPGFPPDSARFDVEVRILDPYTVRLTGRMSGEVVTIAFDRTKMDNRYSSSLAEHPPYWEMEDPVYCPGGDWYYDFQMDNEKGTQKRVKTPFRAYKGLNL